MEVSIANLHIGVILILYKVEVEVEVHSINECGGVDLKLWMKEVLLLQSGGGGNQFMKISLWLCLEQKCHMKRSDAVKGAVAEALAELGSRVATLLN